MPNVNVNIKCKTKVVQLHSNCVYKSTAIYKWRKRIALVFQTFFESLTFFNKITFGNIKKTHTIYRHRTDVGRTNVKHKLKCQKNVFSSKFRGFSSHFRPFLEFRRYNYTFLLYIEAFRNVKILHIWMSILIPQAWLLVA